MMIRLMAKMVRLMAKMVRLMAKMVRLMAKIIKKSLMMKRIGAFVITRPTNI